jgi:cytochrome oxidase Cu insertion factor (SCO1/SenC/PrrC family)
MNRQPSNTAKRTALLKLALVLLLGVGAGAGLFIATLRSTADGPSAASQAILTDDLHGLLDQRARSFDPAALQGRYTIVYFGFTFCPDACPTALYSLTLALQQLDPEAQRIQPLFVSVDPARDTPAQLANYLAHFSEHIIGLTGPANAIQLAEQAFGVIAVEHRDETLPGGYTMDHSNELLLLSRTGKLLTRLPADQTADVLLEQLRGLTRADTV